MDMSSIACSKQTLNTATLVDPGPDKWYGLFIAMDLDGLRGEQPVPYDELETIAARYNVSAVGDHCYNPTVVYAWCAENSVTLPSPVLERLLGRWMIGHTDWAPALPSGWDYPHGDGA